MPGRPDPLLTGRFRTGIAALAALLLAVLLAVGSGEAAEVAKTGTSASDTRMQERIADPATPTPDLESIRDDLVRRRAEAQAEVEAKSPAVEELKGRLAALGEPPAEGVTEPPEIAEMRRTLNQEIADAQAPVIEAQQAAERADALISEIDRTVRARFSAELAGRGRSPLNPDVWSTATREISRHLRDQRDDLVERFGDPYNQRLALRRLPGNILMVLAGIAVVMTLRSWAARAMERRLAERPDPHATGWLFALRNLARLVVSAIGAGLIFAAFDPDRLIARGGPQSFFELPRSLAILIAASWLADSLYAPRLRAHRLLPLADDEARWASRVVVGLGAVVALTTAAAMNVPEADLSEAAQTVIFFPLELLAALGLWQAAKVIRTTRTRLATTYAAETESATVQVGLRFLSILARVLQIIALVGPLLGMAGYLAAAGYLLFPSILSLGIIGTGVVIYDLLARISIALLTAPSEDPGLIPFVVATVVVLAAIPVLALAWGARASDLADAWGTLNEGVTLGGIRISLSVVLTFGAVFILGAGLTRLVQTILRASVLPRTRLDAGGRNAVLAGFGYLGFALAAFAAVSAAGLNLSSLALVAGALSVGIGFGLQNVVSNFVSGIILLVERPVKEGDWIEVGGFAGYVKGINVRSTEIETFDRASVILPNSDLVAGTVLNRTHKGMSGRLQVPVSVTYDANPRHVEEILIRLAEEHPLVLQDPTPRVLFLSLGADTMDFELRCWLRDVNFSLSVRSDLNFEIMERFSSEGIRTRFFGRDLPPDHGQKLPEEASGMPPAGTQPGLQAPEQEDPPAPPPKGAKPG